MIGAVEIENLRGIRRGALSDLAPLTLLVGANGAGKSTVLEALAIGAGHQPPALIGRLVAARGAWNGARYLIPLGADEARITVTFDEGRQSTTRLAFIEALDPEGAERPARHDGPGSEAFTALEFAVDEAGERLTEGRVVFDLSNAYGYRRTRSLARRPRLQFVHPAQARAWPLWENLTRAREQGRLDDVYALLRPLLGDRFQELYVHPEGDGRLLNVHVQYRDGSVPVAASGDGVRTLVRLALEVAGEPGSCVLIEEPEVHQHIRAVWLTAKALLAAARRGVQVILSTHSLELIDALVEQTDDAQLDDLLAVIRLKLDGGVLRHSRLSGRAVARMRGDIEEDLR